MNIRFSQRYYCISSLECSVSIWQRHSLNQLGKLAVSWPLAPSLLPEGLECARQLFGLSADCPILLWYL